MIRVRPSFFDRFSCLASRCRHSCCVGWEIDIDSRTRKLYASVPGPLGEELAEKICDEPEAHFVLDGEERCPFLRRDGLCRIILALGEESLSEICREHPRFYNCFPGREEQGLGLCCEEVVTLLLEENAFLLITEDDGVEELRDPWREELAALREELLTVMQDRKRSFTARLASAFDRLGLSLPAFDAEDWARFLLTLERMDESWRCTLEKLLDSELPDLGAALDDPRYEKLFCYLLYRQLITAEDKAQERELLSFCAVATMLVAALDRKEKDSADEHIRLLSAEIEYSDENLGKICARCGQLFAFAE